MKLLVMNRVAWTALGRNKLRASLAILGIAIGVAAVVSMVAIGDGASLRVRKAIDTLGPNMVWVEEGGVNRGGVRTGLHATKTLSVGDADAIRTLNWLVTNVCPHVDTRAQVGRRGLFRVLPGAQSL